MKFGRSEVTAVSLKNEVFLNVALVLFLDRFSTNFQISNFMNICSVGAELFHADRRTDRQT
jgi:hypothetical protein